MRLRHPPGIWELFVPRLAPGRVTSTTSSARAAMRVPQKADPVAQQTEPPPGTASVVAAAAPVSAGATTPGCKRAPSGRRRDAPISIYEVHIGSWLQASATADGGSLWDFAIERLVPYLVEMGFTHVELLPITEHPFGGSWGYQPLGLFAPSARFGPPRGLRAFRRRAARAPASA